MIALNGSVVKSATLNGQKVKQIDYIHNGQRSTVYRAETVLYENGTINAEVTGGFIFTYSTGGAQVSFEESRIKFSCYQDPERGEWCHAIIWTGQKVDLTNATKICVDGQLLSRNYLMYIHIRQTYPTRTDNPQYANISVSSTSPGILTMDVSDLSGEYYIGVDGSVNGSWYYDSSSAVTRIWLE